ncbi:MAG: hypothetical protein ACI3V2_01935 [Faecousia sp.]
MKKFIAIMMILATLVSLSACKSESTATATDASDVTESTNEQMQASEVTPTTAEGEKPGKDTTGQPDVQTPTTTEPLASTEPGTEMTEPATQPTPPTQPTTPPVTQPPHQHSYTATVVAPTCNDKGYTKHTCSCGDSYKDNYTDALGHHFIDEVVASTATEQGYTKHTCDRCWYSYNDSYTDPVKQVYDINAVMEKANAYALSLGFACIDYSLTPENAGYYPPSYITGDSLARIGGQSWLEQDTMDGALSCRDRLIYGWGADEHTKCACRAYITYDAVEDAYTIYFLYA